MAVSLLRDLFSGKRSKSPKTRGDSPTAGGSRRDGSPRAVSPMSGGEGGSSLEPAFTVRTFFRFAWDANDVDIRVVGSCPQLGEWNPAKGVKLQTSFEYFPSWISNDPVHLPLNQKIEYQYVILSKGSGGPAAGSAIASGSPTSGGGFPFFPLLRQASSVSQQETFRSKDSNVSEKDLAGREKDHPSTSGVYRKVQWVTSPGVVRIPASSPLWSTLHADSAPAASSNTPHTKEVTIDNGAKEGECLTLIPTGIEMTAEDDGGLFRKFSGKTAEDIEKQNQLSSSPFNLASLFGGGALGARVGENTNSEQAIEMRLSALEEEEKMTAKVTVVLLTFLLPVKVVRTEDGKWAVTPTKNHLLPSFRNFRRKSKQDVTIVCVGWPGVHVDSEYDKRLVTDLLAQHDCVPVFPDPADFENFVKFAHGLLWPVFHDVMLSLLRQTETFDEEQWASYQRVNHAYADVAIRHSHDSDFFWVHNYHLLCVPQYLTRKLRMANIGFFLHCPWPSFDIFKAIPVRDDLIRALLCSDLVGFQLYDHARKFFVSTKRLLGLDWSFLANGQLSLAYAGRNVCVKVSHVCISLEEVAAAAERFRVAKLSDQKTIDQRSLTHDGAGGGGFDSPSFGEAPASASVNESDASRTGSNANVAALRGSYQSGGSSPSSSKPSPDKSFRRGLSFGGNSGDGAGTAHSSGSSSKQLVRRRSANNLSLLYDLRKDYPDKVIFAGLDRCESLAGMMLKMNAWRAFLTHHKDWRHRCVLVQCAYPSVAHHQDQSRMERDLEGLVNEINEKFGHHILLVLGDIEQDEKLALFQAADVLLNTQVRDGLNTGPLEYLACHSNQADRMAPMILSEFTGVSQILQGSLKVNPWNTQETIQAIVKCCRMTDLEKRHRYEKDFPYVSSRDPTAWLTDFLIELRAARKKDDKSYVAVVKGSQPPISLRWSRFGANFRLLSMDSTFAKLCTDDVIYAYRDSRRCRVFLLDNEGTLAPNLAARYAKTADNLRLRDVADLHAFGAPPSGVMVDCLNEIMQDPRNILIVISGRTRKQLTEWFKGVPNIGLAAEHGFCYRIPSILGDEWYQEATTTDLSWKNVAFELMKEYTARTQGSWMENKGSALVWQYRDADPEFGDLQAKELGQHLREFMLSQPVEVTNGKGYVEVKIAGINKGAAVSKILHKISKIRGDPDFILCMGDDRSDEDMFEVVNALHTEGDPDGPASIDAKSTTESHGNLQFFAGGLRSVGGGLAQRQSMNWSRLNLTAGADGADGAQHRPSFFTCTVGQKPSKARYYLHDVEEVSELIEAVRNTVKTSLEGDETKLQQVYGHKTAPAGGRGKTTLDELGFGGAGEQGGFGPGATGFAPADLSDTSFSDGEVNFQMNVKPKRGGMRR